MLTVGVDIPRQVFQSRLNLWVYTSLRGALSEEKMVVVEGSFRGLLQVAVGVGTIGSLFPKYEDEEGKFSTEVCDDGSIGGTADSALAWLTTATAYLCVLPLAHLTLKAVRLRPPSVAMGDPSHLFSVVLRAVRAHR